MSPSSISGLNQDCEHIVLLRQFCHTTFVHPPFVDLSASALCGSSTHCSCRMCSNSFFQMSRGGSCFCSELKCNTLSCCIAKEYGTYAPKEKGKKHTFLALVCYDHHKQVFSTQMGLSDQDIVALFGGHTL
ncbi:hypothetical protein ACJX0J_024347, partial [Zea mays]